MSEWTTPAPVRAMLEDLRPADAVALWNGIEAAEALEGGKLLPGLRLELAEIWEA